MTVCGIFGICVLPQAGVDGPVLRQWTKVLFRLSESRGREAAGVAVRSGSEVVVLRRPVAPSALVRLPEYGALFEEIASPAPGGGTARGPVVVLGHSRLVTNGLRYINDNNQPVISGGFVGVHNGIITNEERLRREVPGLAHEHQVDTEVLLQLFRHYRDAGCDLLEATRRTFTRLEGTASVAVLGTDSDAMLLATNCGSLYTCTSTTGQVFAFASERIIAERFVKGAGLTERFGPFTVGQLPAGEGCLVGIDDLTVSQFPVLGEDGATSSGRDEARITGAVTIVDRSSDRDREREGIRRCTRCVLPATVPFIRFDEEGVCNFCRNYRPMEVRPIAELEQRLAGGRRGHGNPDCIVMFSGGRDSSYGLHVSKRLLGLNPVAYTYDWGVITDLARRNAARMCGALGVEHVLVSADIRAKRRNVRRNLQAWLKRPRLGMIPLLMAGDKQYYYYANRLRQEMGIERVVVCECPLELTKFKAGFCGIDEGSRRIFDVPVRDKLRLLGYYARQFLLNPRYLNSSMLDSLTGFLSSYFIKHDYLFLYRYWRWDEVTIARTLIDQYRWELAPDTESTWRIGDGTAAFYNYVYYTVAGFTENDTLRSNQVREGCLSRADALALVNRENRPRWESIEWYARTIGFDLDEALAVIHDVPRLYAG